MTTSTEAMRNAVKAMKALLSIAESDAAFQGAHPARDAAIYRGQQSVEALTKALEEGEKPQRIPVVATYGEVSNAAIKWCGEKDRETFSSDIQYFHNNWPSLPGLFAYVQAEIEKRPEFALPTSPAVGAGWRPMETAPRPKEWEPQAPVLLAWTRRDGPACVGEAYWHPTDPVDGGWWWANTGPGDYHADCIANCITGHIVGWQPLPAPPPKTEGGR